jgi:hypothetical protein
MSLPEITDEDRAVAEEAERIWMRHACLDKARDVGAIAAALVRTGWKPVDPDLILAREVLASRTSCTLTAAQYRSGANDSYYIVETAVAAIKAVRREGERKG